MNDKKEAGKRIFLLSFVSLLFYSSLLIPTLLNSAIYNDRAHKMKTKPENHEISINNPIIVDTYQ